MFGSLGLTRFGGADDSEVRSSLGAGGGVKLMASRHIGARLDGRVYAVFVDGEATSGFCTPGACFFGLDVSWPGKSRLTPASSFRFEGNAPQDFATFTSKT